MDFVQEQLGRLRFEHQLWLNELRFKLQEIEIIEERLLNMIEQYAQTEEHPQLEVFMYEFDLARKSILQFQKLIKNHLESMQKKIQSNGHLKSILNSEHLATRVKLENFRKGFSALKERFHEFGAMQG